MTRPGELYFAYGSNLRSARMFERVPSAANLGAARLAGHGFRMNKRGRDGSAKANLILSPDEHVWGAVYRISSEDWPILDRFEGGYTREIVDVELGVTVEAATTYRSERLIEDALAFDWYLEHIRAGAREHALPGEWCETLDALPAQENDATESARST